MKNLFLLLLTTLTLTAEPRIPYALELDTSKIETIPISNDVDTLLIFPEIVESVIGKGLTTGKNARSPVVYHQGKVNPKTIILRHLDGTSEVLMTIMIEGKGFVFRLKPAPNPASVIYLNKAGEPHRKVRKIGPEEALVKKRAISEERKLELLRLAKDSSFFRERLPKMFIDYEEKTTDSTNVGAYFEAKISRVARFQKENALLFFGTIRNTTDWSLDLSGFTASLRVGERNLPVTKLRAERKIIGPKTSLRIEGLLIGDGKGTPLHLSLDNEFKLAVKPTR